MKIIERRLYDTHSLPNYAIEVYNTTSAGRPCVVIRIPFLTKKTAMMVRSWIKEDETITDEEKK